VKAGIQAKDPAAPPHEHEKEGKTPLFKVMPSDEFLSAQKKATAVCSVREDNRINHIAATGTFPGIEGPDKIIKLL
jgi:hypothetical protein